MARPGNASVGKRDRTGQNLGGRMKGPVPGHALEGERARRRQCLRERNKSPS